MHLPAIAAALLLVAGLQSPAPDRARAEELARSGHNAEAIELFRGIVARNPADTEARLWVARLALRMGDTAGAESQFRAVVADHPEDIDARIGLGMALTRTGDWRGALELLRAVEPSAGENSDLFGALARAYRRAGDDRRALEYFRRARALAPDDPDLVSGFEATARIHGHWIGFEALGQTGAPGADALSGTLTGSLRVAPPLHVDGSARTQHGDDYSDAIGGGGFVWRVARTTTAAFHAQGGPGNIALARRDLSGEVVHYTGPFEIGGNLRQLSFTDASVLADSPILAWDSDRWRLDARYTYSRSSFDRSGETTADHSVVLRDTWQAWRRGAIQTAYAYGIESFEDLTADRIGSLGTTTLAAGVRIDVPSLTRITTTWEHQWRSNETTVDRFTISIVQVIP